MNQNVDLVDVIVKVQRSSVLGICLGLRGGLKVDNGYIVGVCWVENLDNDHAAKAAWGRRRDVMQREMVVGCLV